MIMNENRQNIIVGAFVLFGLVVFGWIVMKFGDLPKIVSRYDAIEITIYFPDVTGIQENSSVKFLGYSVGRIIKVNPPAPVEDPQNPEKHHYRVCVIAAISKAHKIPSNVVPKLYRKGLGSSFVGLVPQDQASEEYLKGGEKITGVISEASEFISEKTQQKFDGLISSFTALSQSLQSQLTDRPPEEVDKSDTDGVRANITTTVMRMDSVLKNLNTFLTDTDNRQNFKKGLTEFATVGKEIRELIKKISGVADEIGKLTYQVSKTVASIDDAAGQVSISVQKVALKAQNAADELAKSLQQLNGIFNDVSSGKGTVGRAFNDPRLYEALTDTFQNLSIVLGEMQELMAQWKAKGVKMKLSR